MKELEYLSEILWDYCLDVYLSVSKRISLDDHSFMWIFTCKVGDFDQKLELWTELETSKTR